MQFVAHELRLRNENPLMKRKEAFRRTEEKFRTRVYFFVGSFLDVVVENIIILVFGCH